MSKKVLGTSGNILDRDSWLPGSMSADGRGETEAGEIEEGESQPDSTNFFVIPGAMKRGGNDDDEVDIEDQFYEVEGGLASHRSGDQGSGLSSFGWVELGELRNFSWWFF